MKKFSVTKVKMVRETVTETLPEEKEASQREQDTKLVEGMVNFQVVIPVVVERSGSGCFAAVLAIFVLKMNHLEEYLSAVLH